MANTLIAFGCSFIGDGSTATFLLDTGNDIFVLGTDVNFSGGNLIEFSRLPNGLNPLGVMQIIVKNIYGDVFPVTTSINGNVITFNLSRPPRDKEVIRVTGYIRFA